MSAPATIRPATLDDLDAWIGVIETVAAERRWIATEPPVDRDRLRERFRGHIDNDRERAFVAVVDGHVAGGGDVQETAPGLFRLGMALAPAARGRGVGTLLLRELVDAARALGAHKITLEVWPHNEVAIRLYERFGFEREGYLRAHYRRAGGELWDSVVMGLRLGDG